VEPKEISISLSQDGQKITATEGLEGIQLSRVWSLEYLKAEENPSQLDSWRIPHQVVIRTVSFIASVNDLQPGTFRNVMLWCLTEILELNQKGIYIIYLFNQDLLLSFP